MSHSFKTSRGVYLPQKHVKILAVSFLRRFIRPILIIFDIASVALALGFTISQASNHEEFSLPVLHTFLKALPFFLIIKIPVFYYLGLYRALLRYASFRFAITVLKAVSVASLLSFTVLLFLFPKGFDVESLFVDMAMTLVLVSFIRFFPRYYFESKLQSEEGEKNVLIYGAGDVGDAVVRSLLKEKGIYKIIGYLDDNRKKLKLKVHDFPVLGALKDLESLVKEHQITELIVAISRYPAESLRSLVKTCRTFKVVCRLAPTIPDMMNHNVSLKNIDIVDLLKRDPEDLDEKQIERFLKGKKVMVTGAAGSIGSELVRQVLRFSPARMVLVDNSEFGLYRMEEELRETSITPHPTRYVLLNLTHEAEVYNLVEEERPDLILHAAAYKHVPMIEANPFFGVQNNIQGTLNIAGAAHRFKTEKFVLISTDKAVHPTNVMGASKRVCELYIQNLNLRSDTEYVAVRFGNVLGSSGSVIPKFLRQINAGGPVTVTHPDVVRYFMLIQEAVELTLQAASIGHGGEIFILNMGKPVRIKDMAEDLIFLAGKEPYKDIDIKWTGLRPGEKLFEELLIDETEKKTQYENITIGKTTIIDWDKLGERISTLLNAAKSNNRDSLLMALKDVVVEFNHQDLPDRPEDLSNVVSLTTRHS